MDDQALHDELEALAGNAFNPELSKALPSEPIAATMARWERLFGLPQDEAINRIMEHRNNLTRTRVSDDHWETVCPDKEAQGYDREAYEFEIDLQKKKANLPGLLPAAEGEAESRLTYLVELNGPLADAEAVRRAASLAELPEQVSGWSVEERRSVELCIIGCEAKVSILRWASSKAGGFEPTILVNPHSLA